MAEIQNLRDIYKREGLQFVRNLFSDSVVISEKINATRFSFEKKKDGSFEFFKKDGKITIIERTLNQLFEDPINYIEGLSDEIKSKIEIGYRFGFRYFHSKDIIEYDKVPLNNLILTDIQNVSTGRVIEDVNILERYSDILIVQKPPIIWHGKLDEVQKTKLIEYLRTPEDKLIDKFKTDSFTRYIISILDPSLIKTALNVDIEKPIDSVIFKFIKPESNETVYAKAVDPFIQLISKTREEEREPQDMFGIILYDIVEFVKIKGVNKYEVNSIESVEERYVNLICKIYNDYIDENGYKYEGVNLNKYIFSESPKLKANKKFILNPKTQELIAASDINEDIFKIMLSSFYRMKRKASGTITQLLISDLKAIISSIQKKVESGAFPKADEILTFEEYLQRKLESSWTIKD